MSQESDNNQTALAGEFAVLSQLALHGYDAAMTLGNTKKIDILIHSKSGNLFMMEVKSNAKKEIKKSKVWGRHLKWLMNEKHEDIKNEKLFYCFVQLADNGKNNRYFIVPAKIVAAYVKKQHEVWSKGKTKSGKPHNQKTHMREFRLGFEDNKMEYKEELKQPLVKSYEDKWDVLSR